MARVAVEIPKIGLVMESVRVTRWLKNVGDAIRQGEPLLEVETEKSVVEIEAAVSGRLEEILTAVGAEARVGDRIAWMEAEQAPAAVAPPARSPTRAPVASPRPTGGSASVGNRIVSTPAARRLAAERGVDLRRVSGTGPGGRVQLADLANETASASAPSSTAFAAPEMTPMQRALARSMTLSNATVPQFTLERSVDGSAVQAARTAYAAANAAAPALSMNDFLLYSLGRALTEMPAMNAIYVDQGGGGIACARGTHIGLVVAVAGGLLVPVLHDVEQLSLTELAARRRDCVERTLQGKLRSDELGGATLSLSNLGAQGPDRFAAMINPPESAILAVGRQRDCVVPRAGGLAVRPMSELTLTVDHRVANGRLAAEFLARLVQILESGDWRV